MSPPRQYDLDTVVEFQQILKQHRVYKASEAGSQRESLKNMMMKKYMDQHRRSSPEMVDRISNEVNYFFNCEAVNENGIKVLKQRIDNLSKDARFTGSPLKRSFLPSLKSVNSLQQIPVIKNTSQDNDKMSVISGKHSIGSVSRNEKARLSFVKNAVSPYEKVSTAGQKIVNRDGIMHRNNSANDILSITSVGSRKAKSVYYLEGENQDEWAKLVQFDAKLFKKEQEMASKRREMKKEQMRFDLELQLREKEQRINKEREEMSEQKKLDDNYAREVEEAARKKEDDRLRRVENDRILKEKHTLEVKRKQREERQKERELEEEFVKHMETEQRAEAEKQQIKKEKNRELQKSIFEENKRHQEQADKQLIKQKEEDVLLQKQYGELLEEQDAHRERVKHGRIQHVLATTRKFEHVEAKKPVDTLDQDLAKMLEFQHNFNQQESEKEQLKQLLVSQVKGDVRRHLDRQVEERVAYHRTEASVDKKQAHIWKQDSDEFYESERRKERLARSLKIQHQASLLDQIRHKQESPNKKKMTLEELKHNKDRITRVVLEEEEHGFKKVSERHLNNRDD